MQQDQKTSISIVVPTLNEAGNIRSLVQRVSKVFSKSHIDYEIIFVDDHSSDKTKPIIKSLIKQFPVKFYEKIGRRGKAYSLLEGFDKAQYDNICMIDADLQYPPEAILPMLKLVHNHDVDLVVTERKDSETSKLRQLSSSVFNFIFTRLLFGINYDSQSGLKVFRKDILKKIRIHPTPWSFDLQFIVKSLENNFKILSYPIKFSERNAGIAKVKVLQVTAELAKASLSLKKDSSSSKVKRGYQRNLLFARQVFSKHTIGLALLLGLGFGVLHSPSVSAASINQDIQVGSLLRASVNIQVPLTGSGTTPASPTTSPTPQAPAESSPQATTNQPTSTPSSPAETVKPSTASQSANPTASATMPSTAVAAPASTASTLASTLSSSPLTGIRLNQANRSSSFYSDNPSSPKSNNVTAIGLAVSGLAILLLTAGASGWQHLQSVFSRTGQAVGK